MVKTKQTACGGSSTRPAGMATATFGAEADDPEQFEDIDEAEWLDLDNPPQAAEKGETSKPTGKEGEGSKPIGNPPPPHPSQSWRRRYTSQRHPSLNK